MYVANSTTLKEDSWMDGRHSSAQPPPLDQTDINQKPEANIHHVNCREQLEPNDRYHVNTYEQ